MVTSGCSAEQHPALLGTCAVSGADPRGFVAQQRRGREWVWEAGAQPQALLGEDTAPRSAGPTMVPARGELTQGFWGARGPGDLLVERTGGR